MAAGTAERTQGTPIQPTGSKTSEAELAARIEASQHVFTDAAPKPQPKPAARQAPPEETEEAPEQADDGDVTDEQQDQTDDTTDAGTDAGETDEQEQPEETDESPSELATIRKEMGELKALLRSLTGRGKDATATDDSGGSAGPSGKSDKQQAADRLAAVRAKLAKAKGTDKEPGPWKEIIEESGLDELVEELVSSRDAAKNAAQQQQQAAQVAAADHIHKAINNIARADMSLAKTLGIGRHATLSEQHLETRSRIMGAAIRALEDSHEEVRSRQRKAPITEAEALAIGIKRVTGKDVGKPGANPADRQATERSRMVRAYGGGSSHKDKGQESNADIEARLASNIDAFFKGN